MGVLRCGLLFIYRGVIGNVECVLYVVGYSGVYGVVCIIRLGVECFLCCYVGFLMVV